MKAALSVTGDDLHAYADGQLSPERAAQVGDALEREPALAAAPDRASSSRTRSCAPRSIPGLTRHCRASLSTPLSLRARGALAGYVAHGR